MSWRTIFSLLTGVQDVCSSGLGIFMSRFLLATSTLAASLLTPTTAFAQSDGQNQAPTPRATDIIVIGMLNTDQATAEIERTPGAVEVIPDTAFKNTPVQHIKDILGFAPGVIPQPRMGDDARISVRGSGLSRAYRSAEPTSELQSLTRRTYSVF